MDSLIHDLGGALRYLRRNLRFSAVAVLILTLGIAAATTVFSASEALLLRPLPYPDGERLVGLRSVSPSRDSLYERVAPGTLAGWRLPSPTCSVTQSHRFKSQRK